MKGELSVTEMRRFSSIVSGGLALIGLVGIAATVQYLWPSGSLRPFYYYVD